MNKLKRVDELRSHTRKIKDVFLGSNVSSMDMFRNDSCLWKAIQNLDHEINRLEKIEELMETIDNLKSQQS